MATRRWCRNRIKKRPLSERSEFRTLPDFGASDVCSPRSGPPSSGSPSLGYFSWRSKRSDPAAGPEPGLVVRQDRLPCFTSVQHLAAKPQWQRGMRPTKARRRCDASLAGEPLHSSLPWGVAGCSSRRPTRFFASPKKWGKKGDPYDGGPLRGLHTPPAPKSGSVRNSLRSDSGRFFIRFRHQRRGAINGDSLQRQRPLHKQRQRSLRGQLHWRLRRLVDS